MMNKGRTARTRKAGSGDRVGTSTTGTAQSGARKGGRSRIASNLRALRNGGVAAAFNRRGRGRGNASRGGARRGGRSQLARNVRAGRGTSKWRTGRTGRSYFKYPKRGVSVAARTDRIVRNVIIEADSRGQAIELFTAPVACNVNGFSWNGTATKVVRSTAPSLNQANTSYNCVLVVLQKGESIEAALNNLAVPYFSTSVEGVSALQLAPDGNDLAPLERGTKRQRIGENGAAIVTANNNNTTQQNQLQQALQNRAEVQAMYLPQDEIVMSRSGTVQWTEGSAVASQFNMALLRNMRMKAGDRLVALLKSSAYQDKVALNTSVRFRVIN